VSKEEATAPITVAALADSIQPRLADQPGTTQVETRIGENAPTQIESGMGLTVCEVHPNS
jgi:hypothetical protein